MSDDGQRAAFAAWAANEGITKVGFSPVEALGRTIGNVWGVRDHHLVLLDREWGIWQASQASRPRTAATGPGDLADRILTQAKDPASPLSKALWGDPPDAPEACPRCGGKRGDIGRVHDPALDDLIDEETGSLVPLSERWRPCPMCVERETPSMDRMVAEYNAKHATPASATAEAKCGTCGGTGPDRPHIQTRTFFGKCPDAFHGSFPATPAPPVCPRCRGGGAVIIADLPDEGLICGGRCPCGASLGTHKDKPS